MDKARYIALSRLLVLLIWTHCITWYRTDLQTIHFKRRHASISCKWNLERQIYVLYQMYMNFSIRIKSNKHTGLSIISLLVYAKYVYMMYLFMNVHMYAYAYFLCMYEHVFVCIHVWESWWLLVCMCVWVDRYMNV